MQLMNIKKPAFHPLSFQPSGSLVRLYTFEKRFKTCGESPKPFGKELSPYAETLNHSGSYLWEARKSFYFSQIDEINNNWNQIRTN